MSIRTQTGGMALVLAIAVAGLLTPFATGCGGAAPVASTAQDTGSHDVTTRDDSGLPSRSADRWGYYDKALRLMSEPERMRFFNLSNNTERDQFLRNLGADVRVDLDELLRVGMSRDQAQQALETETAGSRPIYFGRTETLLYERFGGRGYTKIYVNLVEGEVYNWGSYNRPDYNREQIILAECSQIEDRLAVAIRHGDTLEAVRSKYEAAKAAYDNAVAALGEPYMIPDDDTHDGYRLNPQARRGWQDELTLGIFEEQMAHLELISRLPDEVREHDTEAVWVWHYPFGERMIHYSIRFEMRRVAEWRAEPVPEYVEPS